MIHALSMASSMRAAALCRGAAHRRRPPGLRRSMPASWPCKALSAACRAPMSSDAFRARIAAIAAPPVQAQAEGRSGARLRHCRGWSRSPVVDRGETRGHDPPKRAHGRRRAASARSTGAPWRASIMISAVLASGATQWVMFSGAEDGFAAAVASGHRRSLLAASRSTSSLRPPYGEAVARCPHRRCRRRRRTWPRMATR